MSSSIKSSVTSTLKPRNIFYVWYTELCRRANTNPLNSIKPAKPKNDVVLDFVADRIKCEEWTPILHALCLDTSLHVISIKSRYTGLSFNYEINTEEKARKMKKPSPVLWTDYILKFLTKSLGCCIKNSQVLSSLELDGIPMYLEYLELLLHNLRYSRSVKVLSFKRCQINDCGCQMICANLRLMPNIIVVNLSSCNLTALSGQYLSKIIQHQQINRYSESWHNSLRYEEPDSEAMGGIKRLTLNNNPNIGDDGLVPILDALDDDLWIKAIDMQNCGISENMSNRILSLVEQSNCIEIADFRNNENLTTRTMEKILEAFEKKYRLGNNPEFQWGETNTSICDNTFSSTRSTISGFSGSVQKARSATLRNLGSVEFAPSKGQLRRTKTQIMIDKGSRYNDFIENFNNRQLSVAKKQLSELHIKLQAEKSIRLKTEKVNNELQRQLVSIRNLDYLQHDRFLTPEKITKVVRIIEDLKLDENEQPSVNRKTSLCRNLSKDKISIENTKRIVDTKKVKTCNITQPVKSERKPSHSEKIEPATRKSVYKPEKSTKLMSPIYEMSSRQNSVEDTTTTAQNLFAQLLLQSNYKNCIEENNDLNGTILQYCCETDLADSVSEDDTNSDNASWIDQKTNMSSDSDSSLELLYREIDAVDQDLNFTCLSTFNVF
ncbi:hypothetical protein RN001_007823 [Aquatica leii]|uniref:Centrosomal protein of 78 kDa n=1 Tax=Aquatica leii TaxID=1421715 RepID=A0AAN7SFR6_9COLE|nr:hypothetical protein RN001_007823 [Aquatica leii]